MKWVDLATVKTWNVGNIAYSKINKFWLPAILFLLTGFEITHDHDKNFGWELEKLGNYPIRADET